jgi:Putative transposase
VAISKQRLVALDEHGVTFRWKDYRAKGRTRYKTMSLAPDEFMRRFLPHVLPGGFHRIRHYGLLANAQRSDNLDRARELLNAVPDAGANQQRADALVDSAQPAFICPDCGAPMIIVDTIMRAPLIRAPPSLQLTA